MDVRITHIGGPTVLIEAGDWRLLTDPTFDPPGRTYRFGPAISSRKLVGPAVPAPDLGRIDAVLLSHDHHEDNLDDAGRALLPGAGAVLTTVSGAQRLGAGATGLAPWDVARLEMPGAPALDVTATPARHGPPLSKPLVGDVIGFGLRWEGQDDGALWITGDTVLYDAVRAVPRRLPVDTMLVHLGGVRFTATGPLRYTMIGDDAVELCRLARPRTVVPIHYEGWAHFAEGRDAAERAFAAAPDVARVVRWAPIGEPFDLPAAAERG